MLALPRRHRSVSFVHHVGSALGGVGSALGGVGSAFPSVGSGARSFGPAFVLGVAGLITTIGPSLATPAAGQRPEVLSEEVSELVAVDAEIVALANVRIVDGRGGAPLTDQTIVIRGNRIAALGPSAEVEVPDGAEVLDLEGHTVIPGIVGLHNHTHYQGAQRRLFLEMSAPRMYLGSGVTTIRTTGSFSPYGEITLKAAIERGEAIGPRMHITGPYITGPGGAGYMSQPADPEAARRVVRYWAEEGATWFKGYAGIQRAELAAAIDEAHRLGLKVTGHLGVVTYTEAAEMGIDSLEHGLYASSDFDPAKEPDERARGGSRLLAELDMQGPEVEELIRTLVGNGVAVTSTLAVLEQLTPGRPVEPRTLEWMAPEVREAFERRHEGLQESAGRSPMGVLLPKLMAFERRFVEMGGLLAAGVDPTGNGGAIPGFGDQRNFELLIEAGFTPAQAIQIMSHNGARVLEVDEELGSVEVGKLADLVVIEGDLVEDPATIRQVRIVFKDGVGFDSAAVLESVRGMVGER